MTRPINSSPMHIAILPPTKGAKDVGVNVTLRDAGDLQGRMPVEFIEDLIQQLQRAQGMARGRVPTPQTYIAPETSTILGLPVRMYSNCCQAIVQGIANYQYGWKWEEARDVTSDDPAWKSGYRLQMTPEYSVPANIKTIFMCSKCHGIMAKTFAELARTVRPRSGAQKAS